MKTLLTTLVIVVDVTVENFIGSKNGGNLANHVKRIK